MRSSFTIMARLFISVFVIGAFVLSAHAQVGKYTYTDTWGKQGFSVKDQKSDVVVINYSVGDFSISQMDINGKGRHNVTMPGHFMPSNEGVPNLPGNGRYIAIPNGAKVEFEIVNSRKEIIQNVDVAPAPVIPLDTDKEPLKYNEREDIYSKNAFFPESPVMISEVKQLRGVETVMMGITPFQYNPVTKELIVYRDLEVNIKYVGGDGTYGDNRLRSRWWDPIMKSSLLNADVLEHMDYSKRAFNQTKDNEEYEYVIIVPNDPIFSQWADSVKLFRTMQGINTGIVTLDEIGGNSVNDIEGYIDGIYENWEYPPAAILLMGDYGSDANTQITSPIYDDYCVSDNIFADVDNDHLPDIVFARMTAQNAEHLETMVTKFINYEKNPPVNADFYNHPITALGWQTARWFQVCSESIGGFWKNELGKKPVRINEVYEGNPNTDPWSTAANTSTILDYFGPDGLGYIPASPSELGDWEGGNAEDITTAINSGAFMLQHRDHGGEDGWGEPRFRNSNIEDLTNTDLTFIFSINCLTGKYNHSSECFTEKFHRHTNDGVNSGALGLIAASEVSYSFVNDTYVWGMYDYMWPEFMPDYVNEFPEQRGILPAFANVYGKYFLDQSNWPSNPERKELTNNLFHHHGDAYLNVYSEVPQDLAIVHNDVIVSGAASFAVSANEGSLIALSVEGELIGVTDGTGSDVELPLELLDVGTIVDVVVTKQNYYRYHAKVLVVDPDANYVIKDEYLLNDDLGNNNGLIDFKESIEMDLSVKNACTGTASNVDVDMVSDNPFVSFTDATEYYGDVTQEGSDLIQDAYTFDIGDGIADQTLVNLTINATDGSETWLSYINFRVNAPVLKILSMDVEELTGNNNGYLEPGETAKLLITSGNIGHANAQELISSMIIESPFIQIVDQEVIVDEIGAGQEVQVEFSISIADNAPNGSGILLTNNLKAGLYEVTKDFTIKIGQIIEDWESGDLSSFDWQNEVDHPWVMVQDEVYEGEYSLRSGEIDHNDTSSLYVVYHSVIDDTISFYRKVSSEGSFDLLDFYVDDQKKGSWSGNVSWGKQSFFVPAGTHHFKWQYRKDFTGDGGSDCAWIDNISFPAGETPTIWAGDDLIVCENSDIELNASETMMSSVEWTTTGSGTFADATAPVTTYTPSAEDVENGSVVLILTGTFGSGQQFTDELNVSFVGDPAIEMDDNLNVCPDVSFDITAVVDNYVSVVWTTNGDGVFVNPNVLETVYTPGVNDISGGAVTLTLHATGYGGCDEVSKDVSVSVNDRPAVDFPTVMPACEGVMNHWTFTLTGVAPWDLKLKNQETNEVYEFSSDENVLFADITPDGAATYMVYDLVDANGCGLSEIGEFTLSFEEPVGAASEIVGADAIDLYTIETSEYTSATVENATSYMWMLEPVDAGTIESNGLTANITWNHEFEGESVTLQFAGLNSCGNGTISEKLITLGSGTGENENGLLKFGLYPNPANEKVRMLVNLEKQQNVNLSIVNNIGSLVYSEDLNNVELIKHDIPLNRLAPGVYHVIIRGNNVNAVRKLVVE